MASSIRRLRLSILETYCTSDCVIQNYIITKINILPSIWPKKAASTNTETKEVGHYHVHGCVAPQKTLLVKKHKSKLKALIGGSLDEKLYLF